MGTDALFGLRNLDIEGIFVIFIRSEDCSSLVQAF